MIEGGNPAAIHEFLLLILLGLLLGGLLLVVFYMVSWFKFVGELRVHEPGVWQDMGAPSLKKLLPWVYKDTRMYWAFYPVLKARLHDARYVHAAATWFYFRLGLALVVLMFGVAGFMVYWMEKHGL